VELGADIILPPLGNFSIREEPTFLEEDTAGI
jgi:hypothetical protein